MQRRMWVALGATFLCGGFIGSHTASAPPPAKVEFIQVPHTKVVHDEPKTIVKTVTNPMPLACRDLVIATFYIEKNANAMYAKSDRQLAIISAARKAMGGYGDLSSVENKQRDLQGDLVGNLDSLEEYLAQYEIKKNECKKASE